MKQLNVSYSSTLTNLIYIVWHGSFSIYLFSKKICVLKIIYILESKHAKQKTAHTLKCGIFLHTASISLPEDLNCYKISNTQTVFFYFFRHYR